MDGEHVEIKYEDTEEFHLSFYQLPLVLIGFRNSRGKDAGQRRYTNHCPVKKYFSNICKPIRYMNIMKTIYY